MVSEVYSDLNDSMILSYTYIIYRNKNYGMPVCLYAYNKYIDRQTDR